MGAVHGPLILLPGGTLRNRSCGVKHPKLPVTCDLLADHARSHECCLRDNSILEWPNTESTACANPHRCGSHGYLCQPCKARIQRAADRKQFEWAAGINHNPYKSRPQLRNLASDHKANKECPSTDEDELLARKREDQRRGINPLLD